MHLKIKQSCIILGSPTATGNTITKNKRQKTQRVKPGPDTEATSHGAQKLSEARQAEKRPHSQVGVSPALQILQDC